MNEKLNFGFYPIYGPLTDICHMVLEISSGNTSKFVYYLIELGESDG
jgi:hypothetical protein